MELFDLYKNDSGELFKMYIKNRQISGTYKMILVVVGILALLNNMGIFKGSFCLDFFYKFTNLSNLVLIIYLLLAAARQLGGMEKDAFPWKAGVKHALMLAISVTCLIAHFMLNGGLVFTDGAFHPSMLVLHYIVPIGAILDWILFDEKGTMKLYEPFLWTIFPLAYLAYSYIMVTVFSVEMGEGSRWPYPFLDADINGSAKVAGTILLLLIIFLALGFLYTAIDRRLAKRSK